VIRPAEVRDMPIVSVLAREFFEASGYGSIAEFDPETIMDRFLTALDEGLCFVAETGNEVIGFVIGASCPSIFNRNIRMGVELAWWVKPEHRNSPASIKLLKAIENQAKKSGIKTWSMVCLEGMEPEKVESMYLRLGYHRAERKFMRHL